MVYINDKHQFIFIENPKSGSTSVLKALEKSLNTSIKRGVPKKAHLTCEQVKEMYPDKWEKYLKVSTFRDPFERWCSSMNCKQHNVKKLNEKQREAIELYFFDGLDQEEASLKLNITQSSFSKRLQRGLSKMKELLGDDFLID